MAAKATNRKYIGIEQDERFCKIAEGRIEVMQILIDHNFW